LRLCIGWRISSLKGYHYEKSLVLKLPSRRTLERHLGNGQEVTNLIETRLKTETELLQPVERICSLIIIDMCIKDKIYRVIQIGIRAPISFLF
jgi:hypothetical protein